MRDKTPCGGVRNATDAMGTVREGAWATQRVESAATRESAVDTQRTVTRARHGVRGGLMHVMRRRVGCAPNGEMSFGAVEVMDFDDFVSGGAVGVLGVVRDHW